MALTFRKVFVLAVIGMTCAPMTVLLGAAELPDYLVSKGGIIYPRTGDSTQELFYTPPHATHIFHPGMLIGVLPEDCISASHGSIGDYYSCHHDLALKPEEHEGKTVYRVIEVK